MAGEKDDYVIDENTGEIISKDEIMDMEEEQEMDKEDQMEEDIDLQEEIRNMAGAPEPDEIYSAHSLLNKAMFVQPDTIKTTFLTESELGRPLFSVRFMLDLHKSAMHYGLERLQHYYWNKIQNITGSGLSNKGFGLNIAVTQKKDTTRRRLREIPKDEKGGVEK